MEFANAHYPYFWAAYGITALIFLGYALSLYRRRKQTRAHLDTSSTATGRASPR